MSHLHWAQEEISREKIRLSYELKAFDQLDLKPAQNLRPHFWHLAADPTRLAVDLDAIKFAKVQMYQK
jgi:hypothetical protein